MMLLPSVECQASRLREPAAGPNRIGDGSLTTWRGPRGQRYSIWSDGLELQLMMTTVYSQRMATITFTLSDEDVERIADQLAVRLEVVLNHQEPAGRRPKPNGLQLSRKEAAEQPGYSCSTLDRLVRDGLLRPNLASRRVLFPVKELDRFINECSRVISP